MAEKDTPKKEALKNEIFDRLVKHGVPPAEARAIADKKATARLAQETNKKEK